MPCVAYVVLIMRKKKKENQASTRQRSPMLLKGEHVVYIIVRQEGLKWLDKTIIVVAYNIIMMDLIQ